MVIQVSLTTCERKSQILFWNGISRVLRVAIKYSSLSSKIPLLTSDLNNFIACTLWSQSAFGFEITVVQRDNSFSSFFCVAMLSFGVESKALRNMSSLAPIVLLPALFCNRFMVVAKLGAEVISYFIRTMTTTTTDCL